MDSVIKPQLVKYLRDLHLPAFASHHAAQAALAANEAWTYDQYLLSLCDMELSQREARRIQKLLTASRLPRDKTLAMFDRTRLKRSLDRQFAALLEGDFLDRRENVLVFGNPGSGKTQPANYPYWGSGSRRRTHHRHRSSSSSLRPKAALNLYCQSPLPRPMLCRLARYWR